MIDGESSPSDAAQADANREIGHEEVLRGGHRGEHEADRLTDEA